MSKKLDELEAELEQFGPVLSFTREELEQITPEQMAKMEEIAFQEAE